MKRALLTLLLSIIAGVCLVGRIGAAPAPRIPLCEPERAYIESHPVITASNEQKGRVIGLAEDWQDHPLPVAEDDYVRKPYMEADIFNQLEKHLEVRFQYAQDESPPPGHEGADSPDRREIAAMLDALPEEMLSRFDEAIDGINPRLGRFLKKLADVFTYDEIVRCLDEEQ